MTIFEEFSVSAYCYADHTQFYVSFDPKSEESEDKAKNRIYKLFTRISEWMKNHHLKLNKIKTVFLPISRDQNRVFTPLLTGSTYISPSESARNLGFIFNRSLTISDHLKHLKKTTFH